MHYILHMFIHYTYLNYIYLLPLCFTCKRDKNYLKKLSVEIFTYLNRGMIIGKCLKIISIFISRYGNHNTFVFSIL